MARGETGAQQQASQQAAAAAAQDAAIAQQSLSEENKFTGQAAGVVGGLLKSNPWLDPGRLAAVRNAYATPMAAQENAARGEAEDYATRTGENSASVLPAIEDLARQNAQTFNSEIAADTASAYDKNVGLQQWGAGTLGDLARVYGSNLGPALGGQTGNIGTTASIANNAASQPSVWQSILSAGAQLGGAAIGAFCVVAGSLIAMFDGSRKEVEFLEVGDELLGRDGDVEKVIAPSQSRMAECCRVTAQDGSFTECSESHALVRDVAGFVRAKNAQGVRVATERLISQVVNVISVGEKKVYQLYLDRTHTYLADGIWAFE